MSRQQPLAICKTKSGRFVDSYEFETTNEARKWLRAEGCIFRNSMLTDIGSDLVTFRTKDYEYEVEVRVARRACRIHREGLDGQA